jgi:hypothetical protein
VPRTSAPTGHAKNETPKKPNVSRSSVVASWPGKNVAAIEVAKKPYVVKS